MSMQFLSMPRARCGGTSGRPLQLARVIAGSLACLNRFRKTFPVARRPLKRGRLSLERARGDRPEWLADANRFFVSLTFKEGARGWPFPLARHLEFLDRLDDRAGR